MADNSISRRRCFDFGVAGALAGGFAMSAATPPTAANASRLPREVWVAAMSHLGLAAKTPQEMCGKMLARMEESLPMQPDIVCTPEVFAFSGLSSRRPPVRDVAEDHSGPILDQFAGFARQHHCYVICSTYTKEAGRCYISSVLFDRRGRYVGEYRKAHPTDGEIALGVTPGPLAPPLFETDFGKIGIQICYDVNWFDAWTDLNRAGAEIVFWPSAFGGGMMLNSLAWMNKYYIVSATCEHPTKIVNPLGEDIVETGRASNWVCAPLNLDVAVIQTVEHIRKFEQVTKKYGRRFQFRILHTEALATIEGTSAEISVPDVLKEFGIPTSRELIAESTRVQNASRSAQRS